MIQGTLVGQTWLAMQESVSDSLFHLDELNDNRITAEKNENHTELLDHANYLYARNIKSKNRLPALSALQLLQKGLSNREIGESLFVFVNTIKFHLKNTIIKLVQ